MTKEENCIYLLIRSVLANCGFSGKLPKTMVTVKWVQSLKKRLKDRYTGYMIDVYGRIDNKWHGIILSGETLDRAVKFMLIYEILGYAPIIMEDPTSLPPTYHTECAINGSWVLNNFLPSRFKNQGLTD